MQEALKKAGTMGKSLAEGIQKQKEESKVINAIIAKAIMNGWEAPDVLNNGEPFASDKFKMMKMYFDRDFAKAFWSPEHHIKLFISVPLEESTIACRMSYAYEYHLQQIVLNEKPIEYLKKFV
jgi:hypothetical protein